MLNCAHFARLLFLLSIGGYFAGAGVDAQFADLYEAVKCQVCEVRQLGHVEGCACDAQIADEANSQHFLPILYELAQKRYFRYFKVDLWRECSFWSEDGQCHLRDCAVCECDPDEIPVCWERGAAAGASAGRSRSGSASSHGSRAANPPLPALARVEFEASRGGSLAAGASSSANVPGWHLGTAAETLSARAGASQSASRELSDRNLLERAADSIAAAAAATATATASAAAAAAAAAAIDDVWMEEDPQSPDLQYVNLLKNPEGYTGYAGPSAHNIWRVIYEENCFTSPLTLTCYHERVFFRLVSGLQSSINTHIAMGFNGGEGMAGGGASAGDEAPPPPPPGVASYVLHAGFAPAVDLYLERLGRHPERLQNLYFAFLFAVRALARARPILLALDYSTGDAAEDAATRALVTRLYGGGGGGGDEDGSFPPLHAAFDENTLFGSSARAPSGVSLASESSAAAADIADLLRRQGEEPPAPGADAAAIALAAAAAADAGARGSGARRAPAAGGLAGETAIGRSSLRAMWRAKWLNISRILDCVGCEKCRLWGKMQFLGLGTAMKILFASEASLAALRLSRNEVVALLNTLHRLSTSLAAVGIMRDLEAARKLTAAAAAAAAGLLAAVVLWLHWRALRESCRGSGATKRRTKAGSEPSVRAESS